MNRREIAVFAPLVLLVLWLGIYPVPVLDVVSASVGNLINDYQQALAAAEAPGLAAAGADW
jgi:NADH-quinone oxidoreductase subunit M